MSDDNTPTRGTGSSDHVTPDSERDALTTDEGAEVARR